MEAPAPHRSVALPRLRRSAALAWEPLLYGCAASSPMPACSGHCVRPRLPPATPHPGLRLADLRRSSSWKAQPRVDSNADEQSLSRLSGEAGRSRSQPPRRPPSRRASRRRAHARAPCVPIVARQRAPGQESTANRPVPPALRPPARSAHRLRHRPRRRRAAGDAAPSCSQAHHRTGVHPGGREQGCPKHLLPAAGCRTGFTVRSRMESTVGVPGDAPMSGGSDLHRWVPVL